MSIRLNKLEKDLEKNAEELKYFLENHVLANELTHDFGFTDVDETTINNLFNQLNLFLDSKKSLEEKIESLTTTINDSIHPINDDNPKINNTVLSRESYDYTFFEELDEFEITSCFAFECAKRKNPFLSINDEAYKLDKINNLVESQNVTCIKNYINEKDTFQKIEILKANIDFLTNLFTDKKFLNQYIVKKFTVEKGLVRENSTGTGFIANKKEKKIEIGEIYNLNDHHLLIKPLYTRPTLGYEKRWEVDVRLNLAQDENELLEYIKHLKKHLYTNAKEENGILKDFSLVSQNIKVTKRELKLKLADSLFIYDALKMNMSQKSIIEELDGYKRLKKFLQDLESIIVKNSQLYFDILGGVCDGNDVSIKAFINSKYNKSLKNENRYSILIVNISCFFCTYGCSFEFLKEKYNIEFDKNQKNILEKLCKQSEIYMNEGVYSHSTYRNYKKLIIEMIDEFKFLQLYSHENLKL